MFSAKQLASMAPKRMVSQATFDDAVKENIDEFDMQPDEALASAVAEFEAQGVDLSCLIKTVAGGNTDGHPAAAAVLQLEQHAQQGSHAAAAEAADFLASMLAPSEGLSAAAAAAAGDELQPVLLASGACAVTLRCVDALAPGPAAADEEERRGALLRTLRLLGLLMRHPGQRDAFREAGGAAALARTLDAAEGEAEVLAAALDAAAAAARRAELSKCLLVEAGIAEAALRTLRAHGGQHGGATTAACSVLCAVTRPDDLSQPSSRQ